MAGTHSLQSPTIYGSGLTVHDGPAEVEGQDIIIIVDTFCGRKVTLRDEF